MKFLLKISKLLEVSSRPKSSSNAFHSQNTICKLKTDSSNGDQLTKKNHVFNGNNSLDLNELKFNGFEISDSLHIRRMHVHVDTEVDIERLIALAAMISLLASVPWTKRLILTEKCVDNFI